MLANRVSTLANWAFAKRLVSETTDIQLVQIPDTLCLTPLIVLLGLKVNEFSLSILAQVSSCVVKSTHSAYLFNNNPGYTPQAANS